MFEPIVCVLWFWCLGEGGHVQGHVEEKTADHLERPRSIQSGQVADEAQHAHDNDGDVSPAPQGVLDVGESVRFVRGDVGATGVVTDTIELRPDALRHDRGMVGVDGKTQDGPDPTIHKALFARDNACNVANGADDVADQRDMVKVTLQETHEVWHHV